MLRLTRRASRIVLIPTLALLLGVSTVSAQSDTRAVEALTPAAAAPAPAADTSSNEGGWLLRSPLLNVSKPEIKAPAVQWDAEAAEAAVDDGRSRLMQPVYRVREAAKSAMERTRSAWNGAVEKMKFRGDGGAPPMFARWFGGGEETPAVAQQPPATLTR